MYLLIHGYGTNISSPFIKPEKYDKGFRNFKDDIDAENAIVFDWSQPFHLKNFAGFNPFKYLEIYKNYRSRLLNSDLYDSLHKYIQKNKPNTIICHSLGCELFLKYLEKYNLPSNVQKIIFIQGDIKSSTTFPVGKVEFTNIYNPLDIMLWLSTFLNRSMRAGLIGFRVPDIKNICVINPLGFRDYHNYPIRSNKVKLELFSI
jgi:hypothetical protein